jgi:ABC transporter substrate binding protein (PQQ-dependent alcohol dehydrogenase system)
MTWISWQASAAAPTTVGVASPMTVHIGYLGQSRPAPASSANLDPLPTDEGYDGAVQAIADDNTTGQFVGQRFEIKDARVPADGDVRAAFETLIGEGQRLILADLPAASLLALADLPEAKDVTLFNVGSEDDDLRGTNCRANVLHTAPSRAMLADALVQYLILKKWQDVFLVVGPTDADHAYAAAIKRSITKFRAHLVAEKAWTFAPGAKRADSGHYAVAAQVAEFTQGVSYDILVVADEDDEFGDYLSYATVLPRPVAGTQGLVPSAWSRPHQEWGATQLQNRFLQRFSRPMTNRDYGAWLAVRAIGEAATRSGSTAPRQIDGYMRSDPFELPGYKGEALSFRSWDGQMRQAILLSDSHVLVSVSPQAGFLHPSSGLDTLGMDRPESQCHVR